jgi:hypothetical protein
MEFLLPTLNYNTAIFVQSPMIPAFYKKAGIYPSFTHQPVNAIFLTY